jgi:hypothetical protein
MVGSFLPHLPVRQAQGKSAALHGKRRGAWLRLAGHRMAVGTVAFGGGRPGCWYQGYFGGPVQTP